MAHTDNLVFFGCRSCSKDFYYEQEWTQAAERGEIELFVAASRDQDDQVYVQHKLREQGSKVWAALERGAVVYISGAADKMPAAVRQALTDIAARHGKLVETEAKAFVEKLETSRRLQEETWS